MDGKLESHARWGRPHLCVRVEMLYVRQALTYGFPNGQPRELLDVTHIAMLSAHRTVVWTRLCCCSRFACLLAHRALIASTTLAPVTIG